MIFDRNESKPVIALLGAGSMGTAIVRRIAAGKRYCWATSARRIWSRFPTISGIAGMTSKP